MITYFPGITIGSHRDFCVDTSRLIGRFCLKNICGFPCLDISCNASCNCIKIDELFPLEKKFILLVGLSFFIAI